MAPSVSTPKIEALKSTADSPVAAGPAKPPDGGEKEDLIQVVNDLQDRLTATGQSLSISLPQIVVVGCQSAGKSSVLENIVGREFLPRGSGVVTRRPTIVQLHPCNEEYAVFLHNPANKITDFQEIKKEIEQETLREPGSSGVSSKPINVQIYSPNVLKLTLVDLPGLVKVAVGDQSDSVVTEIRDMVLDYISQPKCLILAVTPANQDIANSDALNIAALVDPERERTIGVLTKLDLMDRGTHAREILENKVLPLRRGFVGVVNRSQQDIKDKVDVGYSLEAEKRFIQEHPQYRHISARMGTKYLQSILHKQLRSHIHSTLPEVRSELDEKYTACRRELDDLNEKLGEAGKTDKRMFMIRLVQHFIEALKLKLVGQSELIDLKAISGGAHINYLLYTEVQDYLNLELIPDPKDLTLAIANISGYRTSISVPSLAFDAECRVLVEKFKLPLEKCVEVVARVLSQAVCECTDKIMEYPTLKNELIYRVNTCIKQQEKVTKDVLRSHIEAEMNYINMGHPDFEYSILQQVAPQAGPIKIWSETSDSLPADDKKSSDSKGSAPSTGKKSSDSKGSGPSTDKKSSDSKGQSEPSTGNESSDSKAENGPSSSRRLAADILLEKLMCSPNNQKKVDYISAMISKYLEIVRKTVSDLTIKYIMFYLVKRVLEYSKVDLLARLIDSANVESLMLECEDDIERQKKLEETCAAISYALDAMRNF